MIIWLEMELGLHLQNYFTRSVKLGFAFDLSGYHRVLGFAFVRVRVYRV